MTVRILFIVLFVVTGGRLSEARQHGAAIEAARDSVSFIMDAFHVPGITVAVARDGEIIWAEGFGFADLENGVRVTPETRMRVASVSKSITAAALARLYEEGRLDLDLAVDFYVPYWPQKPYPVTSRQLAGHLAGVRHYRDGEFLIRDHFRTVHDGLAVFLNDSLMHAPGEKYLYSSYGWNLLSAVVEGASGHDFLTYMNEQVFEPLGMHSTVAEFVDSLIPNRARFYMFSDGVLVNAPFVDNSIKWAGGGFLSTASDLVRFGSAHLGGDFLLPETVRMLWTSQRTAGGEETNYGIGWQLGTRGDLKVAGHSGGAVGGTSMLMVVPERQLVVAAIGNLQGGPMRRLAEALVDVFSESAE